MRRWCRRRKRCLSNLVVGQLVIDRRRGGDGGGRWRGGWLGRRSSQWRCSRRAPREAGRCARRRSRCGTGTFKGAAARIGGAIGVVRKSGGNLRMRLPGWGLRNGCGCTRCRQALAFGRRKGMLPISWIVRAHLIRVIGDAGSRTCSAGDVGRDAGLRRGKNRRRRAAAGGGLAIHNLAEAAMLEQQVLIRLDLVDAAVELLGHLKRWSPPFAPTRTRRSSRPPAGRPAGAAMVKRRSGVRIVSAVVAAM